MNMLANQNYYEKINDVLNFINKISDTYSFEIPTFNYNCLSGNILESILLEVQSRLDWLNNKKNQLQSIDIANLIYAEIIVDDIKDEIEDDMGFKLHIIWVFLSFSR